MPSARVSTSPGTGRLEVHVERHGVVRVDPEPCEHRLAQSDIGPSRTYSRAGLTGYAPDMKWP